VAGRLRNCRYCRFMLVLMTLGFVLMILVTTNVWDPRPAFTQFMARLTQLSDPLPRWTARIDGAPDVTTVTDGNMVIVASRGFVEGLRASDGSKVWNWRVYWATPAEDVVVARQKPENLDANPDPDRGYSVMDPASGAVKWSDHDAIAVWPYATTIVDLVCPDASPCTLRARAHQSGSFLWQVSLPNGARTIRGLNPHLAGVRDPAAWFDPAAAGVAPRMPAVMAITIDGKIHVVDTFKGVYVREVTAPDRETRVAFSGDRLLFVTARRADAGCVFTVEAFDFASNRSLWKESGFDLDTARGAGCEQRDDPMGAGGRLVVNGSDARPMLVEADTAARTWTGVPGERVLATDGLLAVVLAADHKQLSIIDVAVPGGRALWSGTAGLDPQAAVTGSFVIIRDTDAGKITVLRRGGMKVKLTLASKADIVGVGSNGILLGSGRTIGYQPVAP
jgi:outer membrane protein assembly factor BamB